MRKLTALTAGAVIAATGCMGTGQVAAPEGKDKGEGEEAEKVCLVVAADSSTDPYAVAQMREIYGYIDYSDGRWKAGNSGTVIGYSVAEDAIIWNYPDCTEAEIQYMADAE